MEELGSEMVVLKSQLESTVANLSELNKQQQSIAQQVKQEEVTILKSS
jgi:hypothetical protein